MTELQPARNANSGTPPVTLRDGLPSDLPHVCKSWLNSFRTLPVEPDPYRYAKGIYFPRRRPIVEALLSRAHLTVACHPDDPDTIAGWACWEPGWLHYVFVKDTFRRAGVASMLILPLGPKFSCTHLTSIGDPILFRWRHVPNRPVIEFDPDAIISGPIRLELPRGI